jgi:hypothetical protein
MDPLARSQFFEIISAIESTGLISLMRKATTPVKKMPSTAVLANADSTPKQRPMMPKLQSTGRGTPGSASRGMKAGAIIDADCRLGLTVNQEEIGQGVQNVPFLMELLAAPEILASYLASN